MRVGAAGADDVARLQKLVPFLQLSVGSGSQSGERQLRIHGVHKQCHEKLKTAMAELNVVVPNLYAFEIVGVPMLPPGRSEGMRDDAHRAHFSGGLQEILCRVRPRIPPSGLDTQQQKMPFAGADLFAADDDHIIRLPLQHAAVKSDVVVGDGYEGGIRLARGFYHLIGRASAVVDGGVHVQNPNFLTRRPRSGIVDGEMGEVTVDQNNQPEDHERAKYYPENGMTAGNLELWLLFSHVREDCRLYRRKTNRIRRAPANWR